MKKEKNWKLMKSEPAIDLGIVNIRHDFYKNPRNERVVKTIAIEGNDAVNVIAQTTDGKIILVRQFRFGIGDYTLEIPGGMIDKGENVLVAAQREMREETGYVGEKWEYLGNVLSNPVWMDSTIHHYIMRNAQLKHDLELDEAEDVEIVLVWPEEIDTLIKEGKIKHPHTISAFYFARPYF
ncbi:MAG: NUDIX hydrolase [Bacteroidota bacterium]